MTKIRKTRLDSSVLWMSLLQSVKLSVWTNFTQRHWNSITLDSEVVLFPGKVPRRTTSDGFCPTPLPSQPWEGVLYFHPCQREKNERKIILPGLKSPNAFSGCDFPSEQFLTEWADKITPQTIRLKDRIFIIIEHHSCNYFISEFLEYSFLLKARDRDLWRTLNTHCMQELCLCFIVTETLAIFTGHVFTVPLG